MAKMAMMAKMASRHSHPRQKSIYTPCIQKMGTVKLSKFTFPHASKHLSQQSLLCTSKSVAYHLAFGVREERSNYVFKSVNNLRAVGREK